jgi:hypothetical protein
MTAAILGVFIYAILSVLHGIGVVASENEHTFGTRSGRDATEADSHRLLKVAGYIMDTRTIPGIST